MKYIDPLPITCDECDTKSHYKLMDVRSLQACCINCGYSFKQIGIEINRHYKEAEDYFLKLEIILQAEDVFSIELHDDKVEEILTIQDLLEVICQKTNNTENEVITKVMEIIKELGIDTSCIRNHQYLIGELKYLRDN